MDLSNPVITITTISGHVVSAPLLQWVQALILRLSPSELVQLLQLMQHSQEPLITIPRDTIPADPHEWLSGNGKRS
jgi:hypothetical protein